MKRIVPFLFVLFAAACWFPAQAAEKVVRPFETEAPFPSTSVVDKPVLEALRAHGIEPAPPCSDAVFIRRVYLDVIGTLPDPPEIRDFLRDPAPDKRARLVDALLEREEYAEYWALKWGDLLRVKAEYPVKLWPNAVQAYHRWIRDALRRNLPYDRFARALLTASGSNFRVPPVNFYRAVQERSPSGIAEAVALTFMGTRLKSWPEARRKDLEAFFTRVAYKKTDEWKEEIVQLDPAPCAPVKTRFPDGTSVTLRPEKDPRVVFADWLVTPKNPWFARNLVNRVWSWLMGRGIIEEPDDIRPDNPPSNSGLLACLEREFAGSGFDVKHLFRVILNSRTYQQSSIRRSDKPEAEALFAFYIPRRLDAEVLLDAIDRITGTGEGYQSAIPEPFTFIPERQRTIALSDGSITSPFLELFGRPPRDTGLESERTRNPTKEQCLHLLNSSQVQKKLAGGARLRALLRRTGRNRRALVRALYLLILSRDPTEEEAAAALNYARTAGLNPRDAALDLAWALVNSKEFLFKH